MSVEQEALDLARAANEQLRNALDWGHQIEVINKRLASENARLLGAIHRHYPMIAGHVIVLDEAGDPSAAAWQQVAMDFHALLTHGLRST